MTCFMLLSTVSLFLLPDEGALLMSFPLVILSLVSGIVALQPNRNGYRYPTWTRNVLLAAVIGSAICIFVCVAFLLRAAVHGVSTGDEPEKTLQLYNSPEYYCLVVLAPLVTASSLLFLCLLAREGRDGSVSTGN